MQSHTTARSRSNSRRLPGPGQALLALAAMRTALLFLSFERLCRFTRATPPFAPADPGLLSHTSALIEGATQRLPGTTTCLAQALAASWLLARQNVRSTLVLGAARNEAGQRFHAWVECENRIVIGAEDARGCTRLAAYD